MDSEATWSRLGDELKCFDERFVCVTIADSKAHPLTGLRTIAARALVRVDASSADAAGLLDDASRLHDVLVNLFEALGRPDGVSTAAGIRAAIKAPLEELAGRRKTDTSWARELAKHAASKSRSECSTPHEQWPTDLLAPSLDDVAARISLEQSRRAEEAAPQLSRALPINTANVIAGRELESLRIAMTAVPVPRSVAFDASPDFSTVRASVSAPAEPSTQISSPLLLDTVPETGDARHPAEREFGQPCGHEQAAMATESVVIVRTEAELPSPARAVTSQDVREEFRPQVHRNEWITSSAMTQLMAAVLATAQPSSVPAALSMVPYVGLICFIYVLACVFLLRRGLDDRAGGNPKAGKSLRWTLPIAGFACICVTASMIARSIGDPAIFETSVAAGVLMAFGFMGRTFEADFDTEKMTAPNALPKPWEKLIIVGHRDVSRVVYALSVVWVLQELGHATSRAMIAGLALLSASVIFRVFAERIPCSPRVMELKNSTYPPGASPAE